MPLKTIPFSSAEEVETSSDIQSVRFSGGELTVAIAKKLQPSGKVAGAIVRFPAVQGFRFLDESDLARYWKSGAFTRGFYVLCVEDGGWAAEENDLEGYSSRRKEWLIVTGNGCLSVFAQEQPLFADAELEFDAT